MQCLGQMPGLRGLDLHHYEGRVGNPLTHILSSALVQHLGHCKHLTWLDISLWTLNETQVGATRICKLIGRFMHTCFTAGPSMHASDYVILSGHIVWVKDNNKFKVV